MRSYQNQDSGRFKFHKLGFHGDLVLIDIIDTLINECRIEQFIETGTNVGSTLAFVARKYPSILCLSCEPDYQAYQEAVINNKDLENVRLFNKDSNEFMQVIDREYRDIKEKNTMVWLDAHGYGFKWPLRDEISFFLSSFKKILLLVDDFKVPELTEFGYDEYEGQTCSFEYIQDKIPRDVELELYYPSYTEHTSEHHPLRGWCLINRGQELLFKDTDIGKHLTRAKKLGV